MPPPNPERRDRLADSAIEVLASHGSHGLTHRAVDAAAAVPPGTTSRYFRTRAALLDGVVARTTQLVSEQVDRVVVRPVDPTGLEDALSEVLGSLLAMDASLPLALLELHLEGRRTPHLTEALGVALTSRRDLLRRQCRAAGVDISEQDAMLLEMAVMGIVFNGLTVDRGAIRDLDGLIRLAVRRMLAGYLDG